MQESIEAGVRGSRAILDKFEALSAKVCEPLDDDEMETTLAELGEVQVQWDSVVSQ